MKKLRYIFGGGGGNQFFDRVRPGLHGEGLKNGQSYGHGGFIPPNRKESKQSQHRVTR
jgi:hypothetical protein